MGSRRGFLNRGPGKTKSGGLRTSFGSRRGRDLPREMSFLRHPAAALLSWGSQSIPIYSPTPRAPARAVGTCISRVVSEFPITDLAARAETALEAPWGPETQP